MPDIRFECGRCHQHLTTDSSGAGQSVACPNCGENLVVPGRIAPPPVPPPVPQRNPTQAPTTVPVPLNPSQEPGPGLATAAFVLGIIGMVPVIGIPFGLMALVCGIMALTRKTTAKGKAVTGIVLCALTIILIPVYAALLLPAVAGIRGAAQQALCLMNLKSVGTAVTAYQRKHNGAFPKDMRQLVQEGLIQEKSLHCPLHAAKHENDTYSFRFAQGSRTGATMLAWDTTEHRVGKTAKGRNVLFGDMSVKSVSESDFKKMQSGQKSGGAPPAASNTPGGPGKKPVPRTQANATGGPRPLSDRKPPDLAALLSDLKSGDQHRSITAMLRLSGQKPDAPNPEIARALTALLSGGENSSIRINAAKALENWATKESLPALRQAATDSNGLVSKHAKTAMAKLNPAE